MQIDVEAFRAHPEQFIDLVEAKGEIEITRDGRVILRLLQAGADGEGGSE